MLEALANQLSASPREGVSLHFQQGKKRIMSEARTPEEHTIEPNDQPELGEGRHPDAPEVQDEPYRGPDPEADDKGDGSDEDQGT